MNKALSAFVAFACVGVSLAAAFTDPSAWRLSRFAKSSVRTRVRPARGG